MCRACYSYRLADDGGADEHLLVEASRDVGPSQAPFYTSVDAPHYRRRSGYTMTSYRMICVLQDVCV